MAASRARRNGKVGYEPAMIKKNSVNKYIPVESPFPVLFGEDRKVSLEWAPVPSVITTREVPVKIPLDGSIVQLSAKHQPFNKHIKSNPASIYTVVMSRDNEGIPCVIRVQWRQLFNGTVAEVRAEGLATGIYVANDNVENAVVELHLKAGQLVKRKVVMPTMLLTKQVTKNTEEKHIVAVMFGDLYKQDDSWVVPDVSTPWITALGHAEIRTQRDVTVYIEPRDPSDFAPTATAYLEPPICMETVQSTWDPACWEKAERARYAKIRKCVAKESTTLPCKRCKLRAGAVVWLNASREGFVIRMDDLLPDGDVDVPAKLLTTYERSIRRNRIVTDVVGRYCMKKWGGENPVIAAFKHRCERQMKYMRSLEPVRDETIITLDVLMNNEGIREEACAWNALC